jgi:hypothetical protein
VTRVLRSRALAEGRSCTLLLAKANPPKLLWLLRRRLIGCPCLGGRYMVLLPCHGHHKLIDETEETLLYGKRALICVNPAALAKHGEGAAALDGEDGSTAFHLSAAERRSLIMSFYSHAAPLLPRMCRAAGEVGAMEGKGGAGPRTSEVYMCSEVCPMPQHPRCPSAFQQPSCPCLTCCLLHFPELFAGGNRTHPGHCFRSHVAISAALRPRAPGRGAYRRPLGCMRQAVRTLTLRQLVGSLEVWEARLPAAARLTNETLASICT